MRLKTVLLALAAVCSLSMISAPAMAKMGGGSGMHGVGAGADPMMHRHHRMKHHRMKHHMHHRMHRM